MRDTADHIGRVSPGQQTRPNIRPPQPIEELDDEPVGRLDEVTRAALDRALRFALYIVY